MKYLWHQHYSDWMPLRYMRVLRDILTEGSKRGQHGGNRMI